MVVRRVLGFLGGIVVRDAERSVNRYERALRRNVRRVVFRPIRTSLAICFMTLLGGVVYTVSMRPDAVAAVDAAEGDLLGTALAILPPFPILLAIGLVMVILVPIALISGGIQNDLRYGR